MKAVTVAMIKRNSLWCVLFIIIYSNRCYASLLRYTTNSWIHMALLNPDLD